MSSQHADAFLFYEDAAGDLERTEIPSNPVTIGSRELCGLVLANDTVGPIHAAVEPGPEGCRLRRLSRVRPARVNDAPVQAAMLENGDRITLGDQKLVYVDAPDLAPEMLRLTLARGEDELSVNLPVAGTVTVLGRMEGDILVDDDSVSSRHLEIENFGPGLRWVRDLGSTNGSALNGEPLDGRRRALNDGDALTMGRVAIEVFEDGPPPDTATGAIQRTVIFVKDTATA